MNVFDLPGFYEINLAIYLAKIANLAKNRQIGDFWQKIDRQFGIFAWQKVPNWRFFAKIADLAIFGRQIGDFLAKIADLAIFGEKSPIWRFFGNICNILLSIRASTFIQRS